jgi:hypothetical protein
MTTPWKADLPTELVATVIFTLLKRPLMLRLNVSLENIMDGKDKKEITTLLLKCKKSGLISTSTVMDLLMFLKEKVS